MMKRLHNQGDTIIEVLMCLAIIGSALGAAYAIASRSLNGSRGSLERTEALQAAQSQIERLKATLSPTGGGVPGSIYKPSNAYCFDSSDAQSPFFAIPGSLSADTFTSYPAQCKSGPTNRYNSYILYTGSGVSPPPSGSTNVNTSTFEIHVRWAGASGPNQEIVQYYRLPI